MKFIISLYISALVVCVIYYALVLIMIDTPVPAEYWVAELITVKKELVRKHAGKNKIVIASGSSTLFGIDAEHLSKQLNIPTINFGLFAGLRLEKILKEASSVIENGDILILPLEQSYYDCNPKLSLWEINNIVGWDHEAWNEMDYFGKFNFIFSVTPRLFVQMIIANIQKMYHAPIISSRLAALDSASVLYKFRVRTKPKTFQYSAYNLNDYGDLQRTEGSKYSGKVDDFSKPDHVCDGTANQLIGFIKGMRTKGVQVYFANTPYVASGFDLNSSREGETRFLKEFSRVGCVIDRREDLVFDRKYFFNTNHHLNTDGRSIRTELLLQAIRKNVLLGKCGY